MTKVKISTTVRPDRLAEARAVTGTTSLSQLFDDALVALIDQERERHWLAAHPDPGLPGEVPVDLSSVPWDES